MQPAETNHKSIRKGMEINTYRSTIYISIKLGTPYMFMKIERIHKL